MSEHIGETFEGVISSVTAWGMYVELSNTIEGMIHVTSLKGDYYHYHEDTCELVGEATGTRYRLGQKIQIVVADTDRMLRTINFVLPQDAEKFGLDVTPESEGQQEEKEL